MPILSKVIIDMVAFLFGRMMCHRGTCLRLVGVLTILRMCRSVIMYNNTMISFNMMEAARQQKIARCGVLLDSRGVPGPYVHLEA